MGFLRGNRGLNVLVQMMALKACDPGLDARAGISSKWEIARGPGYLIASGMTFRLVVVFSKESSKG